jgi:hypothetical protein
MSLRFCLLPLLASGLLAAPAAADRVLVAGAGGFVYQTNAAQDNFEYFACLCGGPINDLAADAEHLYAADEFGSVLIFDVDTGELQNVLPLPLGPLSSIAVGGGAIFVGTETALVARVDPVTGALLDTRPTPAGVRALVYHGGFVIAAGADNAVYRAPAASGDFTYFTCFCFSSIKDLAIDGQTLLVGDEFGIVAVASLSTGELLTAFWAGPLNAMAMQAGDLLVHAGAGAILRLDSTTGMPNGTGYTSPIDVRTMLVIQEGPATPPPPIRVNRVANFRRRP